jgi:hypothetical protein
MEVSCAAQQQPACAAPACTWPGGACAPRCGTRPRARPRPAPQPRRRRRSPPPPLRRTTAGATIWSRWSRWSRTSSRAGSEQRWGARAGAKQASLPPPPPRGRRVPGALRPPSPLAARPPAARADRPALPQVRPPGDGVLHDAAALGGRGADRLLRVPQLRVGAVEAGAVAAGAACCCSAGARAARWRPYAAAGSPAAPAAAAAAARRHKYNQNT